MGRLEPYSPQKNLTMEKYSRRFCRSVSDEEEKGLTTLTPVCLRHRRRFRLLCRHFEKSLPDRGRDQSIERTGPKIKCFNITLSFFRLTSCPE